VSKVDRYYVDAHKNSETNVIIRDRISPLGKLVYPTDIAIVLTIGMYPTREFTIALAIRICEILNEVQ
jgi:hypothetical protein